MDAHEAAQMHQNFSQQLLQDHIEACSLPEHNLITVTGVREIWEQGLPHGYRAAPHHAIPAVDRRAAPRAVPGPEWAQHQPRQPPVSPKEGPSTRAGAPGSSSSGTCTGS